MTRRNRWAVASMAAALAAAWVATMADGATAPPGIQATVRSAKVLYRTNEPIAGTVTVKNPGKEPVTLIAQAWLEWELDQATSRQRQTLTIEAGKEATASFRWRPSSSSRGIYGHALRAEVLLAELPVAREADFFNVCDDYWNVALIAAMSAMHWVWDQNGELRADLETAHRETLANFRRDYFNGFEHFFWGEDDFLGLTPQRATWFSGQARYHGASRAIRVLIDLAHAVGLAAVTYAKLTGGGPYGAEIARQHPEWVWNSDGVLSVGRGVGSLARWEDPHVRELASDWNAVDWNMNDPRVLEIGIHALADSATMFGWDGARWDGNFDVRPEVHDLEGRLVEKLTPDQADSRNAANMHITKAHITKVHPRFFYGYNWCQGNWRQSMATNPRECAELCRAGGLIMNEYINQAGSVQHPLHRWEVYAASVADDVEAIKKLGGYYGPILSSENSADGKYTNVFAYAAGAHPYYHHHWGAFITRYSAFIWDNALTRVHAPEDVVLAPDSVWWRHWVFERPLGRRHKQLIVHLINPPAKANVGEGPKPEDVPPPVKRVTVRVFPTLLGGFHPVRATRLSPEPRREGEAPAAPRREGEAPAEPFLQEPVPVHAVEGIWQLDVPEVALWNILVIDLEK